MNNYVIKAGTVDVSVVIRIIDSTDGTPETGVVFNTSGIDLEYRREGAASVDITEATLAALTTAHTDGGFLHIGNGYYRLDLPDAAVASGATGVLIHGTVTGMVVIGAYIQLVAYDPFAVAGLGLTNLDAAVSTRATPAQVNTEADTALADVGLTTTITGRIDTTVSSRLASVGYSAPLDAAGVRSAVGLASANLDTQLTDLPTNAELSTALAAADDAVLAAVAAVNTLAAGAATPAQVLTQVTNALAAIYLDRLFAVDYNPASKPGVSTALLNELIGDDGGVSRFTANTLELAPTGGGGGGGGDGTLTIGERDSVADALLDRGSAIDGYTPRQILRLMAAALLGEDVSVSQSSSAFRAVDDSKTRVTGTVVNRKRADVTLDAT